MSQDGGRRRGRNSGGNNNINNNQRQNGQGQQKKGAGSKRKSRSRSRSKRVDPTKYWGDRELLAIPESFETSTSDTSVVATSLGRAPIPGQENASKHYLSLVYDRAAMLAGALAAAGDIENMRANADALAQELAEAADEADVDDPDDGDDLDTDAADGAAGSPSDHATEEEEEEEEEED